MAVVKPFRAVRPVPALVSRVAALPYDVYSRSEARTAVEGNPLSFLNIDRAETQFGPEADMYADAVYEKAASMLYGQISEGIYTTEDTPCYYIYALTMDGRTQTGLVGCSSIDDYRNGIIRRHENTRADKEEDRVRHVDVCSAQTGPIFLAYRHDEEIRKIIRTRMEDPCLYDFVSEDGIRHRVWRIGEPAVIRALENAFAHLPATYIADGHHRAASAVRVGFNRRAAHPGFDGSEAFNYFLSVLFPDDELKILPYNRVVRDLNGMSTSEFLAAVSESFSVEKIGDTPFTPSAKAEFGLYLDDAWYRLKAGAALRSTDPVAGLDVSILQDHLLAPLLGIGDPRTDKRIDFVGGIRGLKELERRVHTDMRAAFSMYPTSVEELLSVADAGLLMPPKSTWFEPKLRSGLFIHTIER